VTSSTGAHATGTVATFSTAALPVASFEITAIYNGATDFPGSSDSLIQSVTPQSDRAVKGLGQPTRQWGIG